MKTNHKRKFTVIVTCLALATLMLVGLTMAYLTDMRSVVNTLGIGKGGDGPDDFSVKVSLTEPSFVAHAKAGSVTYLNDDAAKGQVTAATNDNILPGDKIYKDPLVGNGGKDSILVRVKTSITEDAMDLLVDEFGLVINPLFELQSDGYYYLMDSGAPAILAPDSAAVPFFLTTGTAPDAYSMTVPLGWDYEDIENELEAVGIDYEDFDLTITAEAIQSRNYGGDTGTRPVPWENPDGSDVVATAFASSDNSNP